MAVAGNLLEAADFANLNLFPKWQASTLQAKMVAFAAAAEAHFPDDVANNRPIGSWLSVIAAFAPSVLAYNQPTPSFATGIGQGTVTTFQTAVTYIYRLFKLAAAQRDANLITVAQGTALLAAYNAQFA